VPTSDTQTYHVIPLSVQQERDFYLVGNAEMGDFYQFPDQGLKILNMLASGLSASRIKSKLALDEEELIDVDSFVSLLSSIGFIHPQDQPSNVHGRTQSAIGDKRCVFSVDSRIAKVICSSPVLFLGSCITLYAIFSAINDPALRLNFAAFYIETNRTPLLLLIITFSLIELAMHETGHMLAAAQHGIKSKYGIGNRLWTIVAESDLTGILSLPKSQRYFPMLAGLFVDIFCASLLIILIKFLLRYGASAFSVQVVQALVLEIVISMIWQFNIFVKTDIYFVLCNFFSHPDLDREARSYIYQLLYKFSFGFLGSKSPQPNFRDLFVLRVFTLIWLSGRIFSFVVLFCVAIPTIVKYLESAVHMLRGPPASIWIACDTLVYVSIMLAMLGVGMYMWLKPR
jgi:putative peptide zinc metalloprotease protein